MNIDVYDWTVQFVKRRVIGWLFIANDNMTGIPEYSENSPST